MKDKLDALRQKAQSLPQSPGVYLMKNAAGEILYVGKAKALKNRVTSYFIRQQQNHWIKVRKMVEQVADFDVILTDSEFEAFVLECSLIKQHMPKYNILLKDDKGYRYIRVTRGEYPNFYQAKQRTDEDAEYIGPYTNAFAVQNSVDEAKKLFRIPQCEKQFPRDIGKSRPCLHHFIGQCSAPCAGKISRKDYAQSVKDALLFLRGGESATRRELEQRMEQAALALDFETAARLRDTLAALRALREKQKVLVSSYQEQDVFALVCEAAESGGRACMAVLRFQDGRLFDSETFVLERPENLPEARAALLQRFYTLREPVPRRVVWDGAVQDAPLLERWLSEKAGKKVGIYNPDKGEQGQLVAMCRSNAAQQLAQATGRNGKVTAALDELAALLALPVPPAYIEAYDISHTAGAQNVAGMVVFRGGMPLKRCYKRFMIKDFTGQDDYAAMAEVLRRRFARYEAEKGAAEGFGKLPDLILLDGGQGQLHAVLPVLEQFGVRVPVFGMVKDSRHRTRAIARDGGEISLGSKRQAFTLVAEIQNEVHRWAIAYHRNKRKKAAFSSSLTQVPGIGEARAKALLKEFGSIRGIRAASVEELLRVKGLSRKAAQALADALGQEFKHETGG